MKLGLALLTAMNAIAVGRIPPEPMTEALGALPES